MASIVVHAVYDGRAFVPTEPVDLPVGATIRGSVEAPAMPDGRPRPQTPEEWRDYLAGVSGSWADFDFVEPEGLPYDREEPTH